MKKNLIFVLSACHLCACTGIMDSSQKIKTARAYQREGDMFQSQGQYTAALAKHLEAEKTFPKDPYLQNSLGLAYMGKKRYDLSVKAFKRAILIKPDYTEARNNLGAAYLHQKKWETAIIQFKKVLDDLIYSTPHFALTNIGWAYLGMEHFPNAQTYFLKALDEQPGFSMASHGLAQVFLRTGQTERTIKYLHSTLKRNPNAAILHADLAQAHEKKGERKQALNAWKLVLKLSPKNSTLARKADKHLEKLIE